jgi:RNA polymerase sigma-70 factor (ECF subfamily)
LQQAILTLPDDQRMVLVMIDVQGSSYDEAAEALKTSMGTVKSRLSRARARMRDYLRERPELLPDDFRHT